MSLVRQPGHPGIIISETAQDVKIMRGLTDLL